MAIMATSEVLVATAASEVHRVTEVLVATETSEVHKVTEVLVATATLEDHRVTEGPAATATSEDHRVTEALVETTLETQTVTVARREDLREPLQMADAETGAATKAVPTIV